MVSKFQCYLFRAKFMKIRFVYGFRNVLAMPAIKKSDRHHDHCIAGATN